MDCILINTLDSQVVFVLTQGTTQKRANAEHFIHVGQTLICNVFQICGVHPLFHAFICKWLISFSAEIYFMQAYIHTHHKYIHTYIYVYMYGVAYIYGLFVFMYRT